MLLVGLRCPIGREYVGADLKNWLTLNVVIYPVRLAVVADRLDASFIEFGVLCLTEADLIN